MARPAFETPEFQRWGGKDRELAFWVRDGIAAPAKTIVIAAFDLCAHYHLACEDLNFCWVPEFRGYNFLCSYWEDAPREVCAGEGRESERELVGKAGRVDRFSMDFIRLLDLG